MLVGIHGKARSGKDTIAEHLVKAHGFTRLAFADPIRRMIDAMGIDTSALEDKEAPIEGIGASYRQLAQTLGTEWGRDLIHPDLWVLLAQRIAEKNPDTDYVLSDVRFENEAAWIRKTGQLWVVVRPDAPMVRKHVSEAGLVVHDTDVRFINDRTIDTLLMHVDIQIEMNHAKA